MSDYTPTNDFSAKALLDPSDPNAEILGADFDTEFAAIQTAIGTKYDDTDLASQAQAEAGVDNTVLMTPLRTTQALAARSGAVGLTTVYDLTTFGIAPADEVLGGSFADVTGMSVALTAGKTYEVIIQAYVTGSGVGQQRIALTETEQQYSMMPVLDQDSSARFISGVINGSSFTSNASVWTYMGTLTANAVTGGTLTLQMRTVSGGPWTAKAGSYIALRQLD